MSGRCHKLSVRLVWLLDAMPEKDGVCDFVFVRRMLSSTQIARWRFSRTLLITTLMAQDGMNGAEVGRKGGKNELVVL